MQPSIRISTGNEPLPVMEQFYTIQGEGAWSGCPAYFIRLAGCDVGCVWCDVKESWHTEGYPRIAPAELASSVDSSGAGIAVITGGEPAMHQLDALTSALKARGIRTHIETSGAHPITGHWHWICFSPKKFKKPLPGVYAMAHELKVVVYNRHDFKWAEEHASLVSPSCQLFLQPEWDKREEMTPLIVEYVKANPRWRISLQTHKYMQIP